MTGLGKPPRGDYLTPHPATTRGGSAQPHTAEFTPTHPRWRGGQRGQTRVPTETGASTGPASPCPDRGHTGPQPPPPPRTPPLPFPPSPHVFPPSLHLSPPGPSLPPSDTQYRPGPGAPGPREPCGAASHPRERSRGSRGCRAGGRALSSERNRLPRCGGHGPGQERGPEVPDRHRRPAQPRRSRTPGSCTSHVTAPLNPGVPGRRPQDVPVL